MFLNHLQMLYLPYTVIDIGWWYHISLPRHSSGRIDAIASPFDNWVAGDGTVISGMTDLRDIGKYIACIIAHPRTLNHKVLAYTELKSQNEVYDLIEKLSGEKVRRKHSSADEIEAEMVKAKDDKANIHRLSVLQYRKSWASEDLDPDLTVTSFEAFCNEALEGKVDSIYAKQKREAIGAAWRK
ncbi:isoflavone reductase [Colletotrichum orchidophilum]|uniref:Isoflavone reductase n=1 Tax=Colletotrichum orchidophilum TaxID=1209926 RepID=A0A1G4B094_9PEZI|nr:isoflavone reductase [Colletotrichum orchidophilum]OHE94804.1 isoflavone reductase [Colletotrichum orchidophilum]